MVFGAVAAENAVDLAPIRRMLPRAYGIVALSAGYVPSFRYVNGRAHRASDGYAFCQTETVSAAGRPGGINSS